LRSRDKDGGHTIRSAIAKTPCYTRASWFYVLQKQSYDLFDPVTLILTR